MNIQNAEIPKETLSQVVETERLVTAARHAEEKIRQALGASGQKQDGPLSPENAQKLMAEAGKHFQEQGINLHFKLLEDSNDVQVELVDAGSRKVIRKIPQDEVVKLNGTLKRLAKGVLDKAV